jgi:hypothetical protein
MSDTNTTESATGHASPMIPGQWEPGSLTRFAVRPEVRQPMVDVTIDAATIADRKREGGGAARKRHPARVSPLTALMRRVLWRIRETPQMDSVREPVAVKPGT